MQKRSAADCCRDSDPTVSANRDKVEHRLKDTPQETLLDRVFSFSMASQLRSKHEKFFRSTPEKFLTLSLEVTNRKTIEEALSKMVAWETLEEYRLDPREGETEGVKCDDAQKRVCLQADALPQTMVVHLKRFVLNFDTFQTEKTNSEFRFPATLNVEPYTAEGLDRLEAAEAEAASSETEAANESVGAPLAREGSGSSASANLSRQGSANSASASADGMASDQEEPKESSAQSAPVSQPIGEETEEGIPMDLSKFDYKLVGAVVHSGTADAGHYYSLIQQRDTGEWLRFDDSLVTPFNPADLADECFGGVDEVRETNAYGFTNTFTRERVKNAYMLVYERMWREPTEAAADKPGQNDIGAQCQIRKELNPEIRQSVWEDNSAFFFDRRVFNSDFFEFMTNLTSKVQIEEQDSSALALESKTTAVLQMASTFALQTVARAEEHSAMPKLMKHVCALYAKSPAACTRFLDETAEDMGSLSELVLRCPAPTVRRSMAQLLNVVLRVVGEVEDTAWLDYREPSGSDADAAQPEPAKSRVCTFLQSFMNLLPTAEKTWTRFEQYWIVWDQWVKPAGQERLEASHRRAMWLTAQHGVWRRENEDLSFLEHMLDLYLTHKTAKLGKAHLKPTFGSLVSCVCSCVSALCASGAELSEKDALMIRVRLPPPPPFCSSPSLTLCPTMLAGRVLHEGPVRLRRGRLSQSKSARADCGNRLRACQRQYGDEHHADWCDSGGDRPR